jgi:MFS family permease
MYGARAIITAQLLQPRSARRLPVERYVPGYPSPDVQSASQIAGRAPGAQRVPLGSVTQAVAAAALIGLIANFSMHLINLRMQNLGIAGSLISLSVAVQAFAIFVSALAAKTVIARAGLRCTLPVGSISCAVALVAIFFSADIYLITVLRVIFGAGLTFLLIASEYLVTVRSDRGNKGHLIAWYTSALGAGTVVGPLLASTLGINESGSFLFGASMLMFGSVALSWCLSDHEGKTTRRSSPFAAFGFMPAAFFAAFVFGMADNGGLSMLPVYGALNGYDNASAVSLAVSAALGATLLQFPIGWLASKRNTTELLVTFGVGALCLLALLPIVIGNKPVAYLVAAGLGAIFEGLYTVALINISRDRRTQSLSSLNACFIAVCSLGEVAGPVASGVSMEYFGPHGLVVALLVVFAVYALGMMNRLRARERYPVTFK